MQKSHRPIMFVLLALASVAIILTFLKFSKEQNTTNAALTTSLQTQAHMALFSEPRTVNPFVLHKADGTPFTEQSLKEHWSLLFFGYTHCPDICPTTLATMNKVWEKLPPTMQAKVQFVFVSIDPDRDQGDKLKEYVAYFNPNFLAVTGNESQLQQLTRPLGVAHFKVDAESNAKNYIVNHTGSLMLFNPKGQYAGIFSPPHQVISLVTDLEKIIMLWDTENKRN